MATARKNRDARILVGYKFDQQSETLYSNSLKRVDAEQKAIARSASLVNGAANTLGRGYRQLEDGTYELRDATESWADNLEHLRSELIKTQDVADNGLDLTMSSVGQRGGNGRRGTAETLDRVGTIGSQIAGAFGGSEAGNALGLVGDLASGFTALGPAGLAAAAGVTALTVVMGELEKQSERNRAVTSARLRAEREAETFAESATTSELLQRREELQSLAAQEATELSELRGELNAFLDSLGLLDAAFAYSNVFLSTNRGTVNAYNEAITASESALTDLNTEQMVLNDALLSTTRSTNDAAEAERQLAAARELLLDAEQRAFTEGMNLTDEQIQERIRSLYDERNAIEKYINVVQPQGERLEEASAQVASLTNQIVGYTHSMEYNMDAVQHADAALKQLTGGIASVTAAASYTVKDLTSALDATRAAQESVTKAQNALTESELKNAQEIAEAERQAMEDAQKLTGKYNLDTKRDAEDLADDLKKIRDDAAYDTLVAEGKRDAMSAWLADKNADKQETEAEKQARKEADRRKEDYNTQLTEQRLVGKRRVDLERSQAEAELNTRRAALITAQNDYSKMLGNQQLIHRSMYGNMLSDAALFAQEFRSVVKDALRVNAGARGAWDSVFGSRKNLNNAIDSRLADYRKAGAFG